MHAEHPEQQQDLEAALGFHDAGDRTALRDESDAEFARTAGGMNAVMSSDLFIESVGQLWDMDRECAKAAFRAGDADRSGRINRHEWLILREAFVHESSHKSHPAITSLRLRAALHSYDVTDDGRLSLEDVMAWLRDLSSGESHLRRIAAGLFRDLGFETAAVEAGVPAKANGKDDDDDHDAVLVAAGGAPVAAAEATAAPAAAAAEGAPPPLRLISSQSTGSTDGTKAQGDDGKSAAAGATPPTAAGESAEQQPTIERVVAALSPGGELSSWLSEHHLSTADMIDIFLRKPGAFGQRMRVVLDGRAETASWKPLGGGGSSAAASRGRSGSSSGSGGQASSSAKLALTVTTDVVPGSAVNSNLVMRPELRAVGGWRGPLAVQRTTGSYFLVSSIIDVALRHTWDVRAAPEMLCDAWMPNGSLLAEMVGSDESRQADAIVMLADMCRKVVAAQPSVVHVRAPAKVFGDVHGQLRDLLLLFSVYGFPTHKDGDLQTTAYVFNGDWVDRGPHQLEAVLLLFALKIMYPARILLVRGNHEFRSQSEYMGEEGFRAAVERLLPSPRHSHRVFEAVHTAFEWLPLAALISESVLVVHGGVGDGSWSVRDLNLVPRPLKEADDYVCTNQALWSDPSDSDAAMRSGVHESLRGQDIPEFGPDVTEAFCEANSLALIIRSHQFCRQGYKVMHSGRLITLFSARNYFHAGGGIANDGAMLLLTPDANGHLRVHPKRLEHLDPRKSHQADWRVKLLGGLAKCMGV